MARKFYRKLIDKAGNTYCVELPDDIDPESVESILVGIHDNIVKLQAYCLAGDVYRLPDNVEVMGGGKEFTFHKKINVFEKSPTLTQEEFGEAIQELLDTARNYRINRAEIKTFEGKPVLKDHRGYYLKREFLCVAEGCENKVTGVQRLSMRDGVISRAQAFEPDDLGATRVRQGSKSWFCSKCAPKTIEVPQPIEEPTLFVEPAIEAPNLPSETVESKEKVRVSPKPDDDLRELLKLSDWKSDVPLEFFKGYVYGILKSRLK